MNWKSSNVDSVEERHDFGFGYVKQRASETQSSPDLNELTNDSMDLAKNLNTTQTTQPFTQMSLSGLEKGDQPTSFHEFSNLDINQGLRNAPTKFNNTQSQDVNIQWPSTPFFRDYQEPTQNISDHGAPNQQTTDKQPPDCSRHILINESQSGNSAESQIRQMLNEISVIVSMQTNLMNSELQEAVEALKLGPRATPEKKFTAGQQGYEVELHGISAVQRKALEDLGFIKELFDYTRDQIIGSLQHNGESKEEGPTAKKELSEGMNTCFDQLEWLLHKVSQIKELQAHIKDLRAEIKKLKDEAIAWDQMVQGALAALTKTQKQQRSSFYHTSLHGSLKLILEGKRAKLIPHLWKPTAASTTSELSTGLQSGTSPDPKAQQDHRLAKVFLNGLEKHREYVTKGRSAEKSSLDPEDDLPQYFGGTGLPARGKLKQGVRPVRAIFNKYKAPLGAIGEESSVSKLQNLKEGVSRVTGLLKLGTWKY